MIIKSVELKNFRQFYGKQKIKFSSDPEKNITLIHAENGVGKTAFLNSILWCFYEKTTNNFEQKKSILNLHAKDIDEKAYYVHVTFEEDGREYVVQRSFNVISGPVFRIYLIDESGTFKEIQQPEVFINSIIPSDMAGYFFFQGEGVGSLANSNNGNVRDAIRDILGFTIAEKTLKDLEKVRTEYRRELGRLDNTSELGLTQTKLAKAEVEFQYLVVELVDCAKEREKIIVRLDQVEKELRDSNVAVVSEKQRSRDGKTKELDRLKSILLNARIRKTRFVGKYAVASFSSKAISAGIDFIDDKKLKGTIPAPYNIQLVEDILRQEACICGADINHGTDAYQNINKLLGKASDPILLDRIRRARSQLTEVKKEFSAAKSDFRNVVDEITSVEESIVHVNGDLKRLSLEIKNINFDDIKDKENSRGQLKKQLTELNVSYGSLTERKRLAESLLTGLINKEKSFQSTEPQVNELRKIISFIDKIEKELKSVLIETESSSILLLSKKINDFLSLYVKQDFNAILTDKYQMELRDSQNRSVGKSDGQSLLLSLTFISSLISLAKDRENATGKILTPGAVAPFVIDAPFGVLDKSYKANIANVIPNSVNQVVFLLSSSHWEGTVEDVIRDRVGVEYNMVLEVSANQGDKQLSNLEISGKKYDAVRYSCDVDMTRIEEVGDYV
jgi:DNA sulfur modification protein DndD